MKNMEKGENAMVEREIESLVVQGGMVQKVEKNDDGAGKEPQKNSSKFKPHLICFLTDFTPRRLATITAAAAAQYLCICEFLRFAGACLKLRSSANAREMMGN